MWGELPDHGRSACADPDGARCSGMAALQGTERDLISDRTGGGRTEGMSRTRPRWVSRAPRREPRVSATGVGLVFNPIRSVRIRPRAAVPAAIGASRKRPLASRSRFHFEVRTSPSHPIRSSIFRIRRHMHYKKPTLMADEIILYLVINGNGVKKFKSTASLLR